MQKLVSKDWRFELFYWDYVWGIVFISLLFAFTAGSIGHQGRTFLEDLGQADWDNIFSAAIGGSIFNLANILFVAAIALSGMSVAFPVSAGLGLILGVLVNYIANPLGNGFYLFSGVALIAIAIFLSANAHGRLSHHVNGFSTKGILLSLTAGVLFGFFYRFIAKAMAADFQRPEAGKLGPYAAVVCFSLGVLASNFVFNTLLMKKPIEGKPVNYSTYLKGMVRDHIMGILGGMIWGMGLVLSILSAGKAGFAVSFGLGQGNAMIAAIWGVFIWKEFAKAPAGTIYILYGMFSSYVIGLVMIILSRVY
jgi:glucose uptake protein